MVTATRTEQKLITGTINGQEVTVPEGTVILEAARMAGIEVPNLCFQPLLRAWGSCRICTVEILGKRGGLIESCATPLRDGMEVLTHSQPVMEARQFILQMYLIDHALDCPTCDKSGECYLQDNTYLHNIHANPYRRPKFAQPYTHFSELIDYKWDRCIMCNRCTRVCDEMIGVTAIESAFRSLEATIAPAYGDDLTESTLCTSCGMCIAVCPVGALTDRHFGLHPWELDTTETICGFCDVGCTLNVEANRGLVRRVTHLWERGVNHGYTCERGKWGHEQVQSAERLFYPLLRQDPTTSGESLAYESTWDEAIDQVAESLAHYQGDQFAMLVSPDTTNEEAYVAQMFGRAVMGSPNVDRYQTLAQAAVADATRLALGADVSDTNNQQELFSDVKAGLVIGPNLGGTAPVTSYWFYHSQNYREAKYVVISLDDYPLGWRSPLYLKPRPGTTATLLNGIAREILTQGLASPSAPTMDGFAQMQASLAAYDLDRVAEITGVAAEKIRAAAVLYATGGAGAGAEQPYPPALIYQTVAHDARSEEALAYGDPAEITAACVNLTMLTGNLGRAGGGVASPRGPANAQGTLDMGAHPAYLPGGLAATDPEALLRFEAAWMPRWGDKATTSNGFVPLRNLPASSGLTLAELPEAIAAGRIKAMLIGNTIGGRFEPVDPRLERALGSLEFLVVTDFYADTPLGKIADVVLPMAMSMEKDGTFTSFDRTVQRLRTAVPVMGEARGGIDIFSRLAQRMGYGMRYRNSAQVMDEIARLVPGYGGMTYARLERHGVNTPTVSFADAGTPILEAGGALTPGLSPAPALR